MNWEGEQIVTRNMTPERNAESAAVWEQFSGIVHSRVTATPALDWEQHTIVGVRATYEPNPMSTHHTPIGLTVEAARSLLAQLQAALHLIDGSNLPN